MQPEITIIDYGAGNLSNVVRAFKACGAQVSLADDPETLIKADRLVFPGVGSFPNAIDELKKLNLFEAIKIFVANHYSSFVSVRPICTYHCIITDTYFCIFNVGF